MDNGRSRRNWGNQSHILNASSNLMGICFVLITGLKLTHADANTYADEISFGAAFLFLCSCGLSYLSMSRESFSRRRERIADLFFLGGIVALFVAVLVFAFGTEHLLP